MPVCKLTHVGVSFVVACLAAVVLTLFIAPAWSDGIHILGSTNSTTVGSQM